jgi:hypothetical protein
MPERVMHLQSCRSSSDRRTIALGTRQGASATLSAFSGATGADGSFRMMAIANALPQLQDYRQHTYMSPLMQLHSHQHWHACGDPNSGHRGKREPHPAMVARVFITST